jgi:hypothetical protein
MKLVKIRLGSKILIIVTITFTSLVKFAALGQCLPTKALFKQALLFLQLAGFGL